MDMREESPEQVLARIIDKTNPRKGYAYEGENVSDISKDIYVWEWFDDKFRIAFAAVGIVTAFIYVRDFTGSSMLAKWACLAILLFPGVTVPIVAVAGFFIDGINWFSCVYFVLAAIRLVWMRRLRMRAIDHFERHP